MFNMPIIAPRLTPPCLTMPAEASYSLINSTTPDAFPLVVVTRSPLGLIDEKL
ncbi:MAG: hypothetical protein BWY65_01231 [Firmicutes bacterium ADurb.Bin373]|nr:MAG: hypothetical protein BWY65_01231 [Firmicutes bacterium ADurb.Bin373]